MSNDATEEPKGGKWCFSRYDYDYRSCDRSTTSGSRGWLSKLGGFNDGTFSYSNWYGNSATGSSSDSAFQGLLNQLQRSANIIGNTDRQLNVRWSNGVNKNHVGSEFVFVSPDNLIDGKNNISEEDIDAITGKVYLASVLRETVTEYAHSGCQGARVKAKTSGIHRGAVRLWEAIETSIARQSLLESWGGLGSYIALDAEKSSASKADIQAYVDSTVESPNIDGATTAIAWNLLNANDAISVPMCYEQCIVAALESLAEEIAPRLRFRTSFELASTIQTLLPNREKECDHGGRPPSPRTCDSSILGEQVENKTDLSLAEQEPEDGKGEGHEELTTSVSVPYGGSSQEGSSGIFIEMESTKSNPTAFASLLRRNASSIASINKSLLFRNNSIRSPSFGHRTGDIDENNLYKLRLNDDRIMFRRDEIHDKNIAICLLVDESGSMSGSKIEAARDVAISLAQGMKGIDGVSVSIYGHTAEEENCGSDCTIREYFTPRVKDMSTCMQMKGRCENHDGFAIQHTANAFNRDYGSYERKIMFVVSDGSPAGKNYNGRIAMDHTNEVNRACRTLHNIEVYGIGIENAYNNSTGIRMYGENNFVVLNDISSSLQIIARFIRQVAMSIKNWTN